VERLYVNYPSLCTHDVSWRCSGLCYQWTTLPIISSIYFTKSKRSVCKALRDIKPVTVATECSGMLCSGVRVQHVTGIRGMWVGGFHYSSHTLIRLRVFSFFRIFVDSIICLTPFFNFVLLTIVEKLTHAHTNKCVYTDTHTHTQMLCFSTHANLPYFSAITFNSLCFFLFIIFFVNI
jgi:hypothetical protein